MHQAGGKRSNSLGMVQKTNRQASQPAELACVRQTDPTTCPAGELTYVFTPVLHRLFDQRHKLVCNGTVDQAMIVSQRQMDN